MSNMFEKLNVVCASPMCRDKATEGDFCMDCIEGERWQRIKQTRESLGLMSSKATGTLPMDVQETIHANREKRAEKARLAEMCDVSQLQMHLDYMGGN